MGLQVACPRFEMLQRKCYESVLVLVVSEVLGEILDLLAHFLGLSILLSPDLI